MSGLEANMTRSTDHNPGLTQSALENVDADSNCHEGILEIGEFFLTSFFDEIFRKTHGFQFLLKITFLAEQ